jgi:DNA-directed RNA polymerase omega subunit
MAELETQNVESPALEQPQPSDAPPPPAPPIESRFLFVDVAALRAKQLRRGAKPRLKEDGGPRPTKPERIAMEEVRRGLVYWELPDFRSVPH